MNQFSDLACMVHSISMVQLSTLSGNVFYLTLGIALWPNSLNGCQSSISRG